MPGFVSEHPIIAALVALFVLDLILRRFGPKLMVTFRRSYRVKAPPDAVWRAIDVFGPDPVSYSPTFTEVGRAPDRPEWVRQSCCDDGPDIVVDLECLERRPGHSLTVRCARLGPKSEPQEEPFTRFSSERYTIEGDGDGTLIEHVGRYGLPPSLFEFLQMRRASDGERRELTHFVETGETLPAGSTSLARKLVWLALSFAAAMWWFGPLTGAMVVGMIAVHELGHALALRLVGEKVISISFIPFLGGATVGTPPKTAMRDAIFSLGGTSFSWIVAVVLIALPPMLGEAVTSERFMRPLLSPGDADWVGACYLAAVVGIVLNVLNLIPVPFLDGGQTVAAMFARFRAKTVARMLGVVGLLIAVGMAILGSYIFAAIAFVLSLLSLIENKAARSYSPPSLLGALGIAGMYAGQFVLYFGAMSSLIAVIAVGEHGSATDRAGSFDLEAAAWEIRTSTGTKTTSLSEEALSRLTTM